MTQRRVFVIDFKEPILKLRKAVSDPELPTIDLDVAISILFEVFSFWQADVPNAIDKAVLRLLEPGWLVEHPGWEDENTEKKYNELIFSALHQFAWDMYRLMDENGLFYRPEAKYSYKRMLNDYTLTFNELE